MAEIKPRYLIFDVESVADGEAILKAKYSAELKAGQNVTPKEAITRFRKERLDERVLTLFRTRFKFPLRLWLPKYPTIFNCSILNRSMSHSFVPM